MRNQKFDSFISDKLSQNTEIILKNSLLQTQNASDYKRSRCSSINENKRSSEVYSRAASKEKNQDFLNKTFTANSGFKVKSQSEKIQQDDGIYSNQYQQRRENYNSNSRQSPSVQKNEDKGINDSQQCTLKLNGQTIAQQQAKRRSRSHMSDNEFRNNNISYHKENNYYPKVLQFEPQCNKNLLEDSFKERSFAKIDMTPDYLYKLKTKTPERNQIKYLNSQLQNYSADKSNSSQIPYLYQNNYNYIQNNTNHIQNHRHYRNPSSNQKQTTQSTFYQVDQKQSQITITQFNDQPLNDPKFAYNSRENQCFLQTQNNQIQLNRKSYVNSRASKVSNFSNILSTHGQSKQEQKLRKYNNSRRNTDNDYEDLDNSEEDDTNKLKDEQSLLTKCQKKLNNSIKILERCISQAQNVQDIIIQNKEKYEKEGNKEMLELLKNFYSKSSNDAEQNNIQSSQKVQQSTVNDQQKQMNYKKQIQIINPEEEKPLDQNEEEQNNKLLEPTPKSELENPQSILKKQINESIKKIEKYLDYSIQVSRQSTIQMDQTQLLNNQNVQPNEIFIRDESFVHKTINLLQFNKQVLSIDLYYSNYQTLPFDFNELEKNSQFLLGQGTFGKVYKVKLYPKNKRYQHQPAVTHHKSKKKNDYFQLLKDDNPEEEDEEYALKVLKCKDMHDLEKRVQEIAVEYYLMQRQFRHTCKLLLPAFYIHKNEQIELLFIKQLADFNFTQLLNKRREKYLVYTEIVKEMHDRNVAHRDIKPSNFVFTKKDRTWKLIDYGTSKIDQDLKQVKEYSVCGTRLYAIPKIAEMKNFGELQSKVKMSLKAYDLYSLGITFIKIKKLLVNPFDQKALKQIISTGVLNDETQISNKIINKLINPNEEERIELDLNDLIEEIENYNLQLKTIPNDYGVMYDNHSDFNYSKQSMEDEDQFERALTFKKINKLDNALAILFSLEEKDTQFKLSKLNIIDLKTKNQIYPSLYLFVKYYIYIIILQLLLLLQYNRSQCYLLNWINIYYQRQLSVISQIS